MKAMDGITRLATALNFTREENSSTLPDEIDLLPAGQTVKGIDGRNWINPGNAQLIKRFKDEGLQLPVDINHATEIKAPAGEPSPAQGWITELFESGGALKGKVAWNAGATKHVGSGQYKYISPAFAYDKKGIIRGIKSAGLVNHPNLAELAALNSQSFNQEGKDMDKILKALGLAEGASEDEVLTAVNTLKEEAGTKTALNMADYIPRADYDLALNRAQTAESNLKAREEAEFKTALNSRLDKAVEAGKIAPASRSFYEASLRSSEDLERFDTFVKDAPQVVATNAQAPEGKPDGEKTALNAEEAELARQFGFEEEEALKVFA